MEEKKITLDDIAGYDDQKLEAKKLINILKNYDTFKAMGAYIPKGVVLSGPCGTGKTSMAKAIANESGVPLYEFENNEAEDEEGTIRNIRELFAKAKDNAPAIVFIDELDELISSRTFMSDYSRKTLKVILTEIDGIKTSEGIMVIVTTNFRSELPDSIMRSGRMDKKIRMPIPDAKSRYEITELYLRKNSIFENVSALDLSSKLGGFCGADIKTLVNETLIECLTEGKTKITLEDFEKIIPVVRFQDIKKTKNNVPDYVCYHETGHFLVNYVLNGKIGSLSVEQYGDIRGNHTHEYNEDEEEEIENTSCLVSNIKKEIAILLAGNVAEKIKLKGDCSTGANSDISRAIDLAKEVASSGVDGYHLFYKEDESLRGAMFQNNKETEEQRLYVNSVLEEAENVAYDIISSNIELLDKISMELKERKKLSREQLSKIVGASRNDILYNDVISFLPTWNSVSVSFIQKEMKIGFVRASKIMDRLEKEGLIETSKTGENFKIIRQ